MDRRVVTLTPNPCVDLNLEVDALRFDVPLRAKAERRRAGGKGINVSEALAVLGVPSVAVAPLGGHSGREFADLAKARLDTALVRLVPIPIGNPTRTNIVVSEPGGRHLKVNQQGPLLSPEEVEVIVGELDRLVGEGTILALCGSLPPGVEPGFYGSLVERYRSRGAFVALDADGEALRQGAAAKPDLVKPNREELSAWAGRPLGSREAFLAAVRELCLQTGGACLATDGPNPACLASAEEAWAAEPLPAAGSPVGAGDCALAGLLSVLWRNGPESLPGPDALRFALACGTASASRADTESLRLEDVERLNAATAEPQRVWP